jgi:hypothetical protein
MRLMPSGPTGRASAAGMSPRMIMIGTEKVNLVASHVVCSPRLNACGRECVRT